MSFLKKILQFFIGKSKTKSQQHLSLYIHLTSYSFSFTNNNQNMALAKISLILFLCLLGFYSKTVKAQNCGCTSGLCCSHAVIAVLDPTTVVQVADQVLALAPKVVILVPLCHKLSLTILSTELIMAVPGKDSTHVILSLVPLIRSPTLLTPLLGVKLRLCLLISPRRLDVRILLLFFTFSKIFK